MANPEEDPYDAEAIRRRVGQQFGIPAQTQEQGGDETTAPAPTDHSVVIRNLRKAAEERAIENAKTKQSEPGAPEAVAGATVLAGQQIGQRIGVPSSDYFNSKSLYNDLDKQYNEAQNLYKQAQSHAEDLKQQHDWLHSEHAVNEILPDEFKAQETSPIVKRAPESPAGGKNYGPNRLRPQACKMFRETLFRRTSARLQQLKALPLSTTSTTLEKAIFWS